MKTTQWLRWLTGTMPGRRLRHGERGVVCGGDDIAASYEHVDGAMLDAGDFRASESMRLDPMAHRDFAETLPGFVCSAPGAPRAAQAAGYQPR